MTTRRCGHPTEMFDNVELRCGHFGCPNPPRSGIVHVGLGLGERPAWRITGACAQHEDQLLDTERLASPGSDHKWAEPQTHPPDLDAILDWIHDDPDRCAIDYFSVTTPGDA